MNIDELLKQGKRLLKNVEDGHIKARILLENVLNKSREYIVANSELDVDQNNIDIYLENIDKIKSGMPIQYITNKQEFMKMDFYVNKNVLIPQPDTEILVEEAIKICNTYSGDIKVLDLCTGSGAIGISIGKYVKNAKVYATDISDEAINIAKKNAKQNNVNNIEFIISDMFDNIKETNFDIIVSNPPYIETDVIPLLSEEVKKEPIIALDGGKDGLKFYKIIPLEIYIIVGILLLYSLIGIIKTGYSVYYYYNVLDHLVYTFICIFGLFTIYYILRKELKSFDKPIEILKTSLIVRVLILGKKIFKDTNKVTKSVPLAKRIIILAALSVGVGTIGWFIGFLFGSTLLLFLFGPILSLTIVILYVYYLIKKLAYLSYIMEGTERIKGGDIHYKLDIIGDDNFSNLAENINNIGDGLDKAIYNQLKSERLKSELITNVSHDLKTPLTSIINYIDYVNVLDSKSKRLKVLIEDLFEASKASSGNLELNMEKIDITQLLRQAIGEMEEKLSKANLDLKLRVPEEKTYIMADGKKLYRVLENLLSNISKYSLNNTRVYIDIIEEDDKVKLTMKNISSYELNFDPEEIMERFKRADESRNTEGSGLGLAIARDLVNAQGGRFEIDIDGDLFKSVVEFNLID